MKIQFDTEEKIIRIEEKVNLGELIEKLDLLLPNSEWKEYTIEPVPTIVNWYNPYIVTQPIIAPLIQTYPPHDGTPFWKITCDSNTTNFPNDYVQQSIYNVEIK